MPLFPLSETEAKFNLFRYKAGKKRTATQLFENCVAELLLDDFHAVGVEFLLALFADILCHLGLTIAVPEE